MPALRFEVFDVLSLIENHVVPFFAAEDGVIGDCYFVAGDAYVEGVEFGPAFAFLFSFLGRTEVGHDLEGWTPSLELDLPVHEDSGWNYDEMWSPNALFNG